MLKQIVIWLGFLPEPRAYKTRSIDETPPIPMDEQTLRDMKAAKEESETIKRKNFITNVIEWCDRHAAIKARQNREKNLPKRTPYHSTFINVEKFIGELQESPTV